MIPLLTPMSILKIAPTDRSSYRAPCPLKTRPYQGPTMHKLDASSQVREALQTSEAAACPAVEAACRAISCPIRRLSKGARIFLGTYHTVEYKILHSTVLH